jgi:hypothetical protein
MGVGLGFGAGGMVAKNGTGLLLELDALVCQLDSGKR